MRDELSCDRCCCAQVLEVSIMYVISDFAESPDVEYPAVPPSKQTSSAGTQQNPGVARSTASYASLNYNGKVCSNEGFFFLVASS